MSLHEFSRRPLDNPQETPLRWSMWWKAAVQNGAGLYIEKALSHLLTDPWVVDDSTGSKAMSFFRAQPGWKGDDGFGPPLVCKQLSPKEEREALDSLPREYREQLLESCVCPPDAPRKNRRVAELAFKKLQKQKQKKAKAMA